MKNEKKELVFVSRHEPNDGQVALARLMGFSGIKQVSLVFSKDPVADLRKEGISEKIIAIVAPSYITNQLLNREYELIEFVNAPIKREKMVFCCLGAYRYKLETEAEYHVGIKQEFISCPLEIEDQIESSLIPTASRP